MSVPLAVLRPELPLALQLELTSRCNLRCAMCPLTTGTSSTAGAVGPVVEDTWDAVLAFARRCQQVFIAGYGEPLTHPRCVELLRDLDEHGVQIHLATNGLLITDDLAAALASVAGLVHVNVSIDSPDPAVYRSLRGASLDRALRGVRRLVRHMDPARVAVSAVVMQANAASLPAFPAVLEELGVHQLELQGVMDYNEFAAASTVLGRADVREVMSNVRTECERRGIYLVHGAEERLQLELEDPDAARRRFHVQPLGDPAVTRQCMVPWEVPFIDKDGGVFACCFAASADERKLGDVTHDPMDVVWADQPFEAFRADLLDGTTTPDICRRCTVAPLGEHPLRMWSAELVPGSLRADGRRVRFQVRNTGTRTWTAADLVRVGCRDGESPIAHERWLFPHRACTFTETEVAPGGLATFSFRVRRAARAVTQRFWLVVEGTLWLPSVHLDVEVPAAPRWRRRLDRRQRASASWPVAGFDGELVDHSIDGDGLVVRVRNTGTRSWSAADPVRLAPSDPRDEPSVLHDGSWLAPNRVGGFAEHVVPPGGIASFSLRTAPLSQATSAFFEVVADGFGWMPRTRCRIEIPARSMSISPR